MPVHTAYQPDSSRADLHFAIRRPQRVTYALAVDTWTSRELPVLRALVAKFDDLRTHSVHVNQLPVLTGLDEEDVKRALRSLAPADRRSSVRPGQASVPILPSSFK